MCHNSRADTLTEEGSIHLRARGNGKRTTTPTTGDFGRCGTIIRARGTITRATTALPNENGTGAGNDTVTATQRAVGPPKGYSTGAGNGKGVATRTAGDFGFTLGPERLKRRTTRCFF